MSTTAPGRCIAFGGLRVDTAVGDAVLRLLSPLGVEAALAAIETRESDNAEIRRQAELALTQARRMLICQTPRT